MNDSGNFTEGKILSRLIAFAIPVLFAQFLQAMYGAADLMIVGRFADAAAVSAVSTGSSMVQTFTNFIVGLSMGVTIHLGQKIGEKSDKTGGVIGTAISFFGAMAAVMTVLVYIFTPAYAKLMNVPTEAFEHAVRYVRICSLGYVFIIAYNLIGSIFRGIGDSRTPLMTVFVAAVINVVLDVVLVAGFNMSAVGAAIATVIAQAFSVIFSLFVIACKGLPFSFTKDDLKFDYELNMISVRFGVPVAMQSVLINISFMFIMAMVNTLGVIASAGVGVAVKLCNFIMLVPSSLSSALSAFAAQNVGAKKYDRARKSLFACIGTSFATGIIIFVASFFYGHYLCAIFASDAEVIVAAAEYLKAYAIDTLLTSFLFCMTGYFNGFGRTMFVMLQGSICAFLFRIPISYLMIHVEPVSLFKVGLSIPITTAIQIVICIIYYFRLQKQLTEY